MKSENGKILIVDDNEDNRIVLARRLQRQGLVVDSAENGREAIERLRTDPFDLLLLDIMMPEMNGYQVLEHLKADSELREVPVIVISAVDEMESVVRCIELGAEDYLTKPFNRVLLKARIGAVLEKKHLRDQEKAYLKLLQIEQEKTDRLLMNILPRPIAERLKEADNEATIADSFSEATVLFADIVEFTREATNMAPSAIVELLSSIFLEFDRLAVKFDLEKIKTVGDAYMVVSGLPAPRTHDASAVAEMGLAMMESIRRFEKSDGEPFTMRVGIHSGPVVAGVIGQSRFVYDLWGDTVNVASRMESHGVPGKIQTTESLYLKLKDEYQFEPRGVIPIKGLGERMTYFLIGP